MFTLNNEDYLVIVDYYSKFFELAKLEDTRSKTIIMHMKSAFARHGIPYEVRSDNGPQYTSRDFKDFARKWSFKHTSSSPYNPQGNGLAEKLSMDHSLNKCHGFRKRSLAERKKFIRDKTLL